MGCIFVWQVGKEEVVVVGLWVVVVKVDVYNSVDALRASVTKTVDRRN